MDYEKEYKKLKAGISNAYLYAQTDSTKAVLENILPELVESEDEKMYARVTGRYTRFEKYYLRTLGETEANKVLKQCEEEELWIKNLLEKQKDFELTEEDKKIIPEALVMLCDDIINHRVHTPIKTDEEGARKIKAFLKTFNRQPHKTREEWEKQKEQEPITDSVKFEEGFKAGRESGLRDGQKYVLNNLDSYGLSKSSEEQPSLPDNLDEAAREMKMNNIEKIRQEIKRRIKSCKTKNGFPAGTISAFRIETYEGLLAFIDSLPEEKEVKMINESVTAETLLPLSIVDEPIEDAAPMLVKQQLAQAVGIRLLQEGYLDFDVQKFDSNRIRVRCMLSFYDLKKR